MAITPEFRAQFAKLDRRDVLTVLSWIVEPGINDPEADVPEELAEAMAPITLAYQNAYDAMIGALEPDGTDRWADEADFRYDMMRDEQMLDAADRKEA